MNGWKSKFWILALIGMTAGFVSAGSSIGDKPHVFLERNSLAETRKVAGKIGLVKHLPDKAELTAKSGIFVAKLDHPVIRGMLKDQAVSVDPEWLGDQGFQIITSAKPGRERMIITATTPVGVLYGLMRVREELKRKGLDNPFKLNLNMRDKPGMIYRATGPYANFLQYWGNFMAEDFTMEDFPELFESQEEYKRWVAGSYARLEKLKKLVKKAHAKGARVFIHTRMPIYAYHTKYRSQKLNIKSQLRKLHPEVFAVLSEQEKAEKRNAYFCWSSEFMKKIILRNYDRIFAKIPDLDGIIIVVHNGTNGYLNCHCENCSKFTNEERLRSLLDSLATTIRKYNPNAKLILRDWGLKHLELNIIALSKTLPKDVGFFTKLTVPPGNDYLWSDNFAPSVKKKVPGLVVWGVNGFHTNDGMSGHMFYMGGKMRERGRKMMKAGVSGIWSSSSEYGCGKLNPKAAAEAAWNPAAFDPLAFLKRWAEKAFGSKAGGHVIKALTDSHKITDFLVMDEMCVNTSQLFHWNPERPGSYGQGVVQSNEVRNVDPKMFPRLRQRYEGLDALRRSGRMEAEIGKAAKIRPKDKRLKKMLIWARATNALVKATSDYNMALLHFNLYKNLGKTSEEARESLYKARTYAERARREKNAYLEFYRSIPKTGYIQGKRYQSFVNEEVENGYDAVMTALSRLELAAAASKCSKSKRGRTVKTVWRRQGRTNIPDVIATNRKRGPSALEMTIDEAMDGRRLLLRVGSEFRGNRGYRSFLRSDADVYVDGAKVGELRRSAQGSFFSPQIASRKGCVPRQCWHSVELPAIKGKGHVISLKPVSSSFYLTGLELRSLNNDETNKEKED